MDATQVLSAAWQAVEAAALPEHVQVVAFEHAIRLIAEDGGQGRPEVHEPVREADESGQDAASPSEMHSSNGTSGESSYFQRFSNESGIALERLQNVYIFDESAGTVKLGVARRRLGDSEAERNRNVAILMVGAKWYAEGKAAVPISMIRDAAKQVGYEPSRNFGKHMESVPGTQAVGVKNDKAVRVQGARFDEPFAAMIGRVLGE